MGLYFGAGARKGELKSFSVRLSGVSLVSPGMENIPPSSGKSRRSWSKSRCAEGSLGYCMCLKVKRGYISAQKVEMERSKRFAVPIHSKLRPSAVSLASRGLENIPDVPANRAEVGQNYDARKAVSATLRVLK